MGRLNDEQARLVAQFGLTAEQARTKTPIAGTRHISDEDLDARVNANVLSGAEPDEQNAGDIYYDPEQRRVRRRPTTLSIYSYGFEPEVRGPLATAHAAPKKDRD